MKQVQEYTYKVSLIVYWNAHQFLEDDNKQRQKPKKTLENSFYMIFFRYILY